MARKSSFRGVNKLRRTLRRIDPEAREHVTSAVIKGANLIADDARSLAPVDTGDLRSAIDVKFGRDKLTAEIGIAPGGGKKRAATRSDLFYARFVEFGTKGGGSTPPLAARPFMGPAFDRNRKKITEDIRKAVAKALRIASGGAG